MDSWVVYLWKHHQYLWLLRKGLFFCYTITLESGTILKNILVLKVQIFNNHKIFRKRVTVNSTRMILSFFSFHQKYFYFFVRSYEGSKPVNLRQIAFTESSFTIRFDEDGCGSGNDEHNRGKLCELRIFLEGFAWPTLSQISEIFLQDHDVHNPFNFFIIHNSCFFFWKLCLINSFLLCLGEYELKNFYFLRF